MNPNDDRGSFYCPTCGHDQSYEDASPIGTDKCSCCELERLRTLELSLERLKKQGTSRACVQLLECMVAELKATINPPLAESHNRQPNQ